MPTEFDTPILCGWEEIAAFMTVGVRTAQTIAQDEPDMPILDVRGMIKADRDELRVWMRARFARKKV